MLDLQPFEPTGLLEYNPYHGKDGKFSSKGGAVHTVAYSGRSGLAGKSAAGMKAAIARHAQRAGEGSSRLAQDNREHGGIGGGRSKAGNKVGRERLAAARRERAPEGPSHTKRTSSGQRPKAAAKAAMRIDRRGSTPRLEQDSRARAAAGQAAPRTRSAMSRRLKMEKVEQDGGKYTTGKARTFSGRRRKGGVDSARNAFPTSKYGITKRLAQDSIANDGSRDMGAQLARAHIESGGPKAKVRAGVRREINNSRVARGQKRLRAKG